MNRSRLSSVLICCSSGVWGSACLMETTTGEQEEGGEVGAQRTTLKVSPATVAEGALLKEVGHPEVSSVVCALVSDMLVTPAARPRREP